VPFFETLIVDVDALWSYLRKIFEERIVILDGAMGTEIQKYKLEENDYRGKKAK
jgi:5-methyltetrahydrofolate--homocysteine methyltransferase